MDKKFYTDNEWIVDILLKDCGCKGIISISHPISPTIYTVKILGNKQSVNISLETLFSRKKSRAILQKLVSQDKRESVKIRRIKCGIRS